MIEKIKNWFNNKENIKNLIYVLYLTIAGLSLVNLDFSSFTGWAVAVAWFHAYNEKVKEQK